jgi:predicted hydrolase (HD superfamily)
MITRDQALAFLNEKIQNKNIVKHMLATEALMGGVYDALAARGKTDLGGTKEEWMMAGLIHDGDYVPEVPENRQGIAVVEWLREKGYEIPDNVSDTVAAHNWSNNGVEPKTLMDWTIFCGDSLTGLIVACALVRPDKKLASVPVESVLKKFKDPSFAGGTRRDDIKLCEEKLGLTLEEFVDISLKSMQKVAEKIGL